MPHGAISEKPGCPELPNDVAKRDPFAALASAPRDRPFVIAQLGQSLDGRIATPTGASRWINGNSALDHLHGLRANVDAVLVGIGTVVADDPLLTVRRVPGKNPVRVILDPRGRISSTARVLNNDGVRRIIVSKVGTPSVDGLETLEIPPDVGNRLDPNQIVAGLFKLGLTKILIEGGASTISAFVDADAVDRLHVLVAPVILGSGIAGLSLNAITGLDEAKRPRTSVHVLDDGDVLFDCELKQSL